jgi:hypothetical protein
VCVGGGGLHGGRCVHACEQHTVAQRQAHPHTKVKAPTLMGLLTNIMSLGVLYRLMNSCTRSRWRPTRPWKGMLMDVMFWRASTWLANTDNA